MGNNFKPITDKMPQFYSIALNGVYKATITSTANAFFNNIKKAAYNMLLQKPTNMNELIDKYINEIKYRTYNFNKNIIIANYINMIYIDNIKKLYSDIIKNIITIKIV